MILLIDNYDSFVHNLARYVGELGYPRHVIRNDALSLDEIIEINPSHIILSPGPCTPDKAGITMDVIKKFSPKIPILGVCLGHQAIGQAFGGLVVRAHKPMHGKACLLNHSSNGIFTDLKNPFRVGRYHSLIVSREKFPSDLIVTSLSEEGEIMSLAHRVYPTIGVQFHPESILTEDGHKLLKNFIALTAYFGRFDH